MTENERSQFETATAQYFEQMAFAPNDRQPPQRWWQETCKPLEGVQVIMPDNLSARLGCTTGSNYDAGQNAFLIQLQQNLKPFGSGGWSGRP